MDSFEKIYKSSYETKYELRKIREWTNSSRIQEWTQQNSWMAAFQIFTWSIFGTLSNPIRHTTSFQRL